MKQRLAQGGADVVTSRSREEFQRFIAAETERWAAVVKAAGADVD